MSLSKEALREKALARRHAIPKDDRARWSEQIRQNFLKRVPLPDKGACISAYCAINSEVDVTPLYRDLIAMGYRGVMPYTGSADGALHFLEWDGVSPLVSGRLGLAEPDPKIHAEYVPDILIVPLAAFDARGYRIGYGKGHYDRTFREFLAKANPHFVTAGVAFDAQALDTDMPAQAHDVPLHMLVTETVFYDFRNGIKEALI